MREEHCDVPEGSFGASKHSFRTPNYGICSYPEYEWTFVVNADEIDATTVPGARKAIPLRHFVDNMMDLIKSSFQAISEDFCPDFAKVKIDKEALAKLGAFSGLLCRGSVIAALCIQAECERSASRLPTTAAADAAVLRQNINWRNTEGLHWVTSVFPEP